MFLKNLFEFLKALDKLFVVLNHFHVQQNIVVVKF